jgi:hypothetical protein
MKRNLPNVIFCIALPILASAQAVEKSTTETAQKSTFKISGFADAYYQFAPKQTTFNTAFTERPNSFAIGMASIKLEKTLKKVSLVADLGWGPRAENANFNLGTTLASVKQIYVSYAPTEKLKFTFGNFYTFVGYEVVDAPNNLNYSTSYGFSKGPFYHTGLKADYVFNKNWAAMVGIFDETDQKFDVDGPRNFGAQVSYSNDKLKVFTNYIAGKVSADTLGLINRQLDVTATFQANVKLGFGLNLSNKQYRRTDIKPTNWQTISVYSNYAFSESYTLALRNEVFFDKNGEGLGTPENRVISTTLSHNFKIDDLKLIAETRLDIDNKSSFLDKKHSKQTNILPAFVFAAIYSF